MEPIILNTKKNWKLLRDYGKCDYFTDAELEYAEKFSVPIRKGRCDGQHGFVVEYRIDPYIRTVAS